MVTVTHCNWIAVSLALFPLLSIASLALASPAAVPEARGREIDTGEKRLVREMEDRLRSDPAAVSRAAERILRSRIASAISGSDDPSAAFGEIESWVRQNPGSAAHLAVGLARDDARGETVFEDSLFKDMQRFLEVNEGRREGLLGRLDRAADASRRMGADQDLDDEERRRLMKQLFEGEGRMDARSTGREPEAGSQAGAAEPGGAAAVDPGGSIYDRLSAANPTGYSPQVLAFQSEMNRRGAPGAPKLIETGHLDYPTLRYPFHALRYDVDRLGERLRAHRAWAAAQALGETQGATAASLRDPAVQKTLLEKLRAKGKDLPEALVRRAAHLERAEETLLAFDREAAKAKDPARVSPALLARLSGLRRDAARWITAASLEETLARLEALRGLTGPELRRAVAASPVEEALRARYLAAGERIERDAASAAEGAREALRLVVNDGGPKALERAEPLIARARRSAKDLESAAAEYREVPRALASLAPASEGWRRTLDDWILRLLPSSSRAKSIRERRKNRGTLEASFRRLAR